MSDPVARLNAALEGRYAIERELGEGGRLQKSNPTSGRLRPLARGAVREAIAIKQRSYRVAGSLENEVT